MSNNLYQQIVRVTHVYLGPAADRFIDRQIQNHLKKTPEVVDANDLRQLIDWIRVAVSFLTDDPAIIEAYIQQLETLAQAPAGRKRREAKGL